MTNNLPYHLNEFSNKIRTMNQTSSKSLLLSASDARNLHLEIFALLAKNVELNVALSDAKTQEPVISLDLRGGSFTDTF